MFRRFVYHSVQEVMPFEPTESNSLRAVLSFSVFKKLVLVSVQPG